MAISLDSVGSKEAKNRFSELSAEVNRTGSSLLVLKHGKPWVVIQPASEEATRRRNRLQSFHALTELIERDSADEPAWDPAVSDKDLLVEERVSRFD